MAEVREEISRMPAPELAEEIRRYISPYAPDVSQSRAVHLLHRAAQLLDEAAHCDGCVAGRTR